MAVKEKIEMKAKTSVTPVKGRFLPGVAGAALALVAGVAQATPITGQGTWETTLLGRDSSGNPVGLLDPNAVFYYDTVLDLTWVRNWNLGLGRASTMISPTPGKARPPTAA